MALNQLGVAEVSPGNLFTELEAVGGFTGITGAKVKPPSYPSGVTKFVFVGGDLAYDKLDQLFSLQGLQTTPFQRSKSGSLDAAPLAAAFSGGKPLNGRAVLVNVHGGGHWVYATGFDGQTITYIDPEDSTGERVLLVLLVFVGVFAAVMLLLPFRLLGARWRRVSSAIRRDWSASTRWCIPR